MSSNRPASTSQPEYRQNKVENDTLDDLQVTLCWWRGKGPGEHIAIAGRWGKRITRDGGLVRRGAGHATRHVGERGYVWLLVR